MEVHVGIWPVIERAGTAALPAVCHTPLKFLSSVDIRLAVEQPASSFDGADSGAHQWTCA